MITFTPTDLPEPKLSASSALRWLECPLSVRLPQEPDEPGPAAKIGTRFHALMDERVTAGKWLPLDGLDEAFEPALRAALQWLNTSLSGSAAVVGEEAFELAPLGRYVAANGKREPKWVDGLTCTSLGRISHREYPWKPKMIYGTVDAIIRDGSTLHVVDWKTGQKRPEYEAQLDTLGVMAAAANPGVTTVHTSAAYVDLKKGKVKDVQTRTLDAFDIHVHTAALTRAVRAVAAKELPEPNPGKHCFFCPAIGCPEKVRKP